MKFPFCDRNESKSTDFIQKFHEFTYNKLKMSIKWITKKVVKFFPLKDKIYATFVKFIKETAYVKRNILTERTIITRSGKHDNTYTNHSFYWFIIVDKSYDRRTRINLKAIYIRLP